MARVIFHIDLNCYFASAEVNRNPSLEGKPIVVAGLSKRSVVCTASYEARKYGVHAAMPVFQALELCPDLVVVEIDHAYYEQLSFKFFKYLKQFSKKIEIASIDECYMDVTEEIKQYARPLDMAWNIQKGLKEALNLSCSIGVAPNKFLAKMASDMRKPMGITVLRKNEVKHKLWPLDISEMFMIGKKTAPILKKAGILTIGDLANEDNFNKACQILGKNGPTMVEHARGNGSDKLVFNTTVQSISQSTTFQNDIEDYDEIKNILKFLCKKLESRAQEEKIMGKMVSLQIRYYDFRNVIRSLNIDTYTNDAKTIYENVLYLFDTNYENIPVRHLGVGLGSLASKHKHVEQLDLFHTSTAPTKQDILKDLNKQIGNGKLVYVSDLLNKKREE